MNLLCFFLVFGMPMTLASQDFSPTKETDTNTVLSIIPEFGFTREPSDVPMNLKNHAAYREWVSQEARRWAEGPTKKLVALGSAAFPAYRKLLASFAKDGSDSRKTVLFIRLAFESMPEHHQVAREIFLDYWNQLRDQDKLEQGFAVECYTKFATKAEIPTLIQMLSSEESTALRRIFQLGDTSVVGLLDQWVQQHAHTVGSLTAQGRVERDAVSLYFYQFVEKQLAAYKLDPEAMRATGEVPQRNPLLPKESAGGQVLGWILWLGIWGLVLAGLAWGSVKFQHRTR